MTKAAIRIGSLLGVFAQIAALSSAQTTTRVSVASGGAQASGVSRAASISADGRCVAFQSDATDLVPGDTNGTTDVFVRDRISGQTTRVSVDSSGGELSDLSIDPSISGDGRSIAFTTVTNMGLFEVRVHDRQTGQTTLVSAAPGGGSGNAHSHSATISAEGRFVAFLSAATNLVPGDAGFAVDVFVRDLQSGTTVLASRDSAGVQGNGSCVSPPAISADGRFVAFTSDSTNLVPGDTNGLLDIFVRDLPMGMTIRVPLGEPASAGVGSPCLSSDGSVLAFHTSVPLVPSDTNGAYDVYVRDVVPGTTTRVSLDSAGAQVAGNSRYPAISADGRYVAFQSDASALVVGDTNAALDLFVRDRVLGKTTRASISSAGLQASGASEAATISADGLLLGFESLASDLVASDSNGVRDVFLIDRTCSGAISSYCVAKTNSLGCVPSIGSQGLPSRSGPDDFFVTAGNVRNRKLGMLLWSRTPGNTPFFGGTLCVGSPLKRTPGQNSGGSPTGSDCSGSYSYHFSQAYLQAQNLPADTTIHAQYWSRDPGFPAPNNVGLTNGLRFTICP